ncbi:MAG TPA: VOC family protein [Rhodothermales bacterium]|nr:VOC family protein [Rhodothermales bacterium]
MRTLHLLVPTLALLCLLLLVAGTQVGYPPHPPAPLTMNKLTPNMMVEDVNQTVDFYRDVLGFNLVLTVPDSGQFDFALVKHDEVEVMFQSLASLTDEVPVFKEKPAGAGLMFFIDVDDVEALYEEVHSRVTIVKDLHDTFYGTREFAMQDCNGFILTFAENGQE